MLNKIPHYEEKKGYKDHSIPYDPNITDPIITSDILSSMKKQNEELSTTIDIQEKVFNSFKDEYQKRSLECVK